MRSVLIVLFALVLSIGLAAQAGAQDDDDGSRGNPGPINPGSVPGVQSLPDPPVAGCVDANLQTSAVASTSGGGSGTTFGPQLAADGAFGAGGELPICCGTGCWNWISAGIYPTSAWFQLEWATPVEVQQIFVDTKPIPSECGAGTNRGLHAADIQTWNGSAWVDHGAVTAQSDDWGFVIPGGPVTTTRLRLNRLGVWDSTSQASNPVLFELKVYDCSQAVPTATSTPTPTATSTPTPTATSTPTATLPAVGGAAIGDVASPSEQGAVAATSTGITQPLVGLSMIVGLALLGALVWGGRRLRHGEAREQ